jgi:stage V sporulation protein D (sporulation-specific penicillin-binding protein)
LAAPGIGLRKRIAFLFVLFSLFLSFLIFRLATIQFWHGNELRRQALDLRTRDVPVEARRGVIYDRNLKELAVSLNVDSVYAIPAQIRDATATAALLAPILGLDPPGVLEKLTKKEAFVWVKRKIEESQSRQLRELLSNGKLRGIDLTQESRRFYPRGSLSSHIIGFAGIDSQGLDGVELRYDGDLRGVPGRIVVEYDARGQEIPQAVRRFYPSTEGNDIVLTIDETVQYIAERELDRAMRETSAKHGSIIVLDPRNGEILAMAVRPDYDPNRYQEFSQDERRNWALSDTYNPGSIFKPITVAAGLEEGVLSVNDHFYCGGAGFPVGGKTFMCTLGTHGSQSFWDILPKSCNVALSQIAVARLGTDKFYKYLDLFNFTGVTGVDLPGEATGIYPPRERAKPVDLGAMSFGQTLTITPIQMAVAYATIANGGVMVRPHVVKEIRSARGEVLKRFDTGAVRQVVSRQTATDVLKAMEKVVQVGTARSIYLDGYRFAGKTGTSQKVVGGRVSSEAHVGSFCGLGPVDNPRLVVLVSIDEPQGSYFGGVIAAPVFQAVMKDLYRYLAIPLTYDQARDKPAAVELTTVPAVIGLSGTAAAEALTKSHLTAKLEGSGEAVVSQVPPSGASVEKGTTVLLTLGKPPPPDQRDVAAVPPLLGLTIRDVAERLSQVGLRLVATGSGLAQNQSPLPGVYLKKGSVVTVKFAPPSR